MPRTLRLTLAYDGTDFHGWQNQPGLRTVQDEVEACLRRILRHPLHVVGASRTDAGVHARGQVAGVVTESPIPTARLRLVIAHHLPADIALIDLADAPEGFHATRDASAKLYRYHIFASPQKPVSRLRQRYTWHIWHPLDVQRMRAAGARLCGTHDFAGFATAGSPRASTRRTIHAVTVRARRAELLIGVEGDGFLYNQVRNIVGTLVEIGRGHWPVERMDEILASRERRLAGPTAPPQGLCLCWVRYPAARIAAESNPEAAANDALPPSNAPNAAPGSGPPAPTLS